MADLLIKIFLVIAFILLCYFVFELIPMDDDVARMKDSHDLMMQCIPSEDDKMKPLKQMFFCPSQDQEDEN